MGEIISGETIAVGQSHREPRETRRSATIQVHSARVRRSGCNRASAESGTRDPQCSTSDRVAEYRSARWISISTCSSGSVFAT